MVGAAGTIGPGIVRDLAESPEVERLVLVDLNRPGAEAVATRHGRGKAVIADSPDGAEVVVNAASYRSNLPIMEQALASGGHYVDLGGLYHVTRRQLELADRFAEAGLLAVLGIGSSPGKTNLMAALGAESMDEVSEVHVSASSIDTGPARRALVAPYALETLLDEITLPPVVVRDGRIREIEALTTGGDVEFADPVGRRETVYTLHSELATFQDSFPGLREATFRLGLPPRLTGQLEMLAELGLADTEPVRVGTVEVAPREALLAVLRTRGTIMPPSERTVAVHLVEVAGHRNGEPVTCTLRAVTKPHEKWGFGGGLISTAAPAAEAARRILRGEVDAAGVLPPERVFTPRPFLEALRQTGCEVYES